jgi:5-formyltetrahydrofolate cyclo-ligase
MVTQKKLRQRLLAERDGLSAREVEAKSAAITEALFRLAAFRACRTVMFYASFRSEVQTWPAMTRCLEGGARLALPLTLPAVRALRPRVITNLDLDLRAGYCGIAEPDPEKCGAIDPTDLEAVIVPGSVFDSRGGRLGYGGGYYDRFLAREAPRALRIGLAFALQVVEGELPLAEHDQRLDFLVTEERVFNFAGPGLRQ